MLPQHLFPQIFVSSKIFNKTYNNKKPCFPKYVLCPSNLKNWLRPAAGVWNGHFTLEIGTKKQKVSDNLKSVSWFRFIDLILAMTLYLPVWHSHCTRASFTVPVRCSDELAVHSCPLRLQTHVAKLASALFYCCPLLRNNSMATNLQRLTSIYNS